jgi:hypothetical protein
MRQQRQSFSGERSCIGERQWERRENEKEWNGQWEDTGGDKVEPR